MRDKKQRAARAAARSAEPEQPKRPKALRHVLEDDGQHRNPVFSYSLVDRQEHADFGWHLLEGDAAAVMHFMFEMSRLTWGEVESQRTGGNNRHRKHHDQPIESLCDEAQRRLAQLEYDDMGDIFRFRLGGEQRLWGFRLGPIFHAVWWDPNHAVCLVERE